MGRWQFGIPLLPVFGRSKLLSGGSVYVATLMKDEAERLTIMTWKSALALAAGLAVAASPAVVPAEEIQGPMREFRGVWVATVANIDWPSRPGLPTETQQAEAIEILDRMVELNMNAVVFQIRPMCDAFYDSPYEPWSHYLTGEQGKAPEPFYDPLEFWVTESHKRGLELHTWFNPYRARHSGARNVTLSPDHIQNTNPELLVELADGHLWMIPTEQEVQDWSIRVVMDVVERYDIDAVHFDDYFYPYASYNNNEDFPDDDSWQAYLDGGGTMTRSDWRRNGVNVFMERLYNEIKEARPHVKFGLSPFGIWRPGHPRQIQGLDQYEALFADAKLWLNEGWVDYYTPQLYWPIRLVPQSFPVLLGWWQEQNTHNRNMWPGIGTHTLDATNPTRVHSYDDIVSNIMVARGIVGENPGHVHFSMRWFQNPRHTGLGEKLLEAAYAEPALVPPSPWLGDTPPNPPRVEVERDDENIHISWAPAMGTNPFRYVVYTEQDSRWSYEILNRDETSYTAPLTRRSREIITSGQGLEVTEVEGAEVRVGRIAVTAVDRLGNESERVLHDIP